MEKILYFTHSEWEALPTAFKYSLQSAGWRLVKLDSKQTMPQAAQFLAGNIRILFDDNPGVPESIQLQSGEVIILPSVTFDESLFKLEIWEHVFRKGFGKTLKDRIEPLWVKPK